MAYRSFEDLEVWQRACKLAVKIYETLAGCRDFGLKDQMCRAVVSIASNIAEGAERNSIPDFIRFLNFAKGSSAELRTQVYIAHEIKRIDPEIQKELIAELKTISRMAQSLIRSLKASAA